MKNLYFSKKLATLFLGILGSATFVSAQTVTWTGSTSADWSDPTNWQGSVAPSPGCDVVINSSVNIPSINSPSFAIESLTINSTAEADVDHTLTITNSLSVANNGTVNGNGHNINAGDLQGNGTIQDGNYYIGGDGNNTIFSGRIEDQSLTTSLTITGNSTLTLSGNDMYSGTTTVNSGATLQLGSSGAIPDPGTSGEADVTINGTLDLNNESSTINGLNGSGTITNSSSSATTVTVGNNGDNGSFSGVIQDGGGQTALTVSGGELTLSGTNTYSGTTTVNSGATLQLASFAAIPEPATAEEGDVTINGTLDMNNESPTINGLNGSGTITNTGSSSADLTVGNNNDNGFFSGLIEDGIGGGQTGLYIMGGTLTLTTANTFSDGTTLSAGQLNINNTSALGTGSFLIDGGSIDNTSGAPIDLTGGGNNSQLWNGNFTFIGTNDLNIGTSGVTMFNNTTVTTNASNLTVGGVINDNSDDLSLTKSGSGTLTLSGANIFSGGVTLNAGQLNINNASALGGTFEIGAGTTIDNTSGGAIDLTSGGNNPEQWDGNYTFIGSSDLHLGTAAVTLTSTVMVTVNAGTLTEGGSINDVINSLTTTGGGTFSFGSGFQTEQLNSLTVISGTFVSTSSILSLAGNFSNSGTFTHNNGQVNFNGGSAQTIGGSADAVFFDLYLNNTSGGVSLNTSESMQDNLNFLSGNLILGSNNLSLGTSAYITGAGSSNGYVVTNGTGTLTQASDGTLSFTFPVGDASNYSPISFNFTGASTNLGATISVLTSNSKEANITASTNYLNRYWTVSQSGLDPFNCSVQGSYVAPGDVIGTETDIDNAEWTGSSFSYNGAVDNINHQINFSGVTTFGDFTGTPGIPLSTTASVTTNVSCNGGNNGSATANPSGGVTPYTYMWSDGNSQATATATGLAAGSYTVTVTDNSSAIATASVVITQPNALTASANTTANVTCNGSSTGTASSTVSGGTLPYTYSWTGGAGTNAAASGLSAGTYTITVKDACGASKTASVTITQPITLSVSANTTADVTCNGSSTGSASATVSGGNSPYTYTWSPTGGNTNTANGLTAGTYTVAVQDACGSSKTATVVVTQPTALKITVDSVNANSGCDGVAQVNVSGGAVPYTYNWVGGGTTDTVNHKCAGTYTCTVTDNNGCSETAKVTIITTTGIENISTLSGVNIYPNPTQGNFTITGVTQGQVIEVYNYLGQELSTTTVSNNSAIHFNISARTNGIYLIRILNTNGALITEKKIIKTE